MGRVTKGGQLSLPLLAIVGSTLVASLALPGGVGEEDATGLLPAATCDRYEQVRAIDRRLAAPEVYELDSDALGDLLARQREVFGRMADRSTGGLHRLLDDADRWQRPFDAAVLDDWDAQRRRLAADGVEDWRWQPRLAGETLVTDGGERIDLDDVGAARSLVYQVLAVRCYAPELADGPRQDTSEAPPGGRLIFYRPTDDDFSRTGRLVTAAPTGEHERTLRRQPYEPLGYLDTVPSGDHGVLVGVRRGEEFGVVVAGADGEVLDSIQRAPGQLICPSWDDGSTRVLAMDNDDRDDVRRVHLVDLTGATPSRPLDLPFTSVGCADFVTDDRLVVAEAGEDAGGDTGLWTVGIDGSDPRELYVAPRCTTQVGSVDPTGTRVAIAQTCDDMQLSGVLVVDLSSGAATRVATGLGALPKWSPDGDWLVFGLIPLAQDEGISVWMARADGRRLHRVVEAPASFPVWLPSP